MLNNSNLSRFYYNKAKVTSQACSDDSLVFELCWKFIIKAMEIWEGILCNMAILITISGNM